MSARADAAVSTDTSGTWRRLLDPHDADPQENFQAIGLLILETPPQLVLNTFRVSLHPWFVHAQPLQSNQRVNIADSPKDSTFQASRDSGTFSRRQSQKDEGKGGLVAL